MLSLHSYRADDALEHIETGAFAFVAAASSEERSTAWAAALGAADKAPRLALLADYSSTMGRPPDDVDRLDRNVADIAKMLGVTPEVQRELNPYSFAQCFASLERALERAGGLPLLVDYTSMSTIHIMALARLVADFGHAGPTILLCYSTPRFYEFGGIGTRGWKDTLFVPVGSAAQLDREGLARGLILAGHDEERLSVALQEFEPDGGVVLYTATDDRPDFLKRAKEANRGVVERLLKLRIQGDTVGSNGVYAWEEQAASIDDIERIVKTVGRLAESTHADRGPVVVFPFGPRISILVSALTLACAPGVSSWAVVPVPSSFRIDDSRGSGRMFCIQPIWARRNA